MTQGLSRIPFKGKVDKTRQVGKPGEPWKTSQRKQHGNASEGKMANSVIEA